MNQMEGIPVFYKKSNGIPHFIYITPNMLIIDLYIKKLIANNIRFDFGTFKFVSHHNRSFSKAIVARI